MKRQQQKRQKTATTRTKRPRKFEYAKFEKK